MAETEQKRVILWVAPRTLSTAFYRAMTNGHNIKCIYEPYVEAYYKGEERKSRRITHLPLQKDATYADMRKSLENDFSGFDAVFVKAMGYTMADFGEGLATVLPRGYKHTFLIRNPKKSIPSLYKTSLKVQDEGWGYFDPAETSFQQLWELYSFVTETLKQETIVIDADDLVKDPENMLKHYCQFTGIKYDTGMMAWSEENLNRHFRNDVTTMDWFDVVRSTNTFLKPHDCPQSKMDEKASSDPELQKAIEDNTVFYMKLYGKRHVL